MKAYIAAVIIYNTFKTFPCLPKYVLTRFVIAMIIQLISLPRSSLLVTPNAMKLLVHGGDRLLWLLKQRLSTITRQKVRWGVYMGEDLEIRQQSSRITFCFSELSTSIVRFLRKNRIKWDTCTGVFYTMHLQLNVYPMYACTDLRGWVQILLVIGLQCEVFSRCHSYQRGELVPKCKSKQTSYNGKHDVR